jgi:hypothetical protein
MNTHREGLRESCDEAFCDYFCVNVVLQTMQQDREFVSTVSCD